MSGKVSDYFRQEKANVHGRTKLNKVPPPSRGTAAALAPLDDGLSATERVLRQFDLEPKFGPCTGMTRLERWQRADRFGLNPPDHIKELLMANEGNPGGREECLWTGRI